MNFHVMIDGDEYVLGIEMNVSDEDTSSTASSSSSSSSKGSTADSAAGGSSQDAELCDSCGVGARCALQGLLNKCQERRGSVLTSLLQAHVDLLNFVERSHASGEKVVGMDWSHLYSAVERTIAGDKRRKEYRTLQKVLCEIPCTRAKETFTQSSERLLQIVDVVLGETKSELGEDASPPPTTPLLLQYIDKKYEASLDRSQLRSLQYLRQLWRKNFRGSAKHHIDKLTMRLDLCYDFSILVGAHSIGFEVVVCAAPTTSLSYLAERVGAISAEQKQNILFNLCGKAAQDWRATVLFMKNDAANAISHYIGIRNRKELKVEPLPMSFLLESSILPEEDLIGSLFENMEGPFSAKSSLRAAKAKRLLRTVAKKLPELPRPPRLSSLSSMAAYVLKQSRINIGELPSHLDTLVSGAYKCVSCRLFVVPHMTSKATTASWKEFETQASSAGFHTEHAQIENLRDSIMRGDAWFPPLVEAMCYMPIPNRFHVGIDSPEHCNMLHRGGKRLCQTHWPCSGSCGTLLSGGQSVVARRHSANDSMSNAGDEVETLAEAWQFCAACASQHLCDPVSRTPRCACPLCEFEAGVLAGDHATRAWRHFDTITDDDSGLPVRSAFGLLSEDDVEGKRLHCPFCEEGEGITCDPLQRGYPIDSLL